MASIDCNKELKSYHSESVTLSNDNQKEMRDRRDNGRTRLENGLTKASHPLPEEFSSQGSYAMRTMVQDDECDYDIDDGVYFDIDDLKDSSGGALGALQARQRVRKALKDDRLSYDAVVKTNCVRQQYPAGYHIDIPVYRTIRTEDIWGKEVIEYEHASGDEWLKSDARRVTKWFNDAVGSELKTGDADTSQLRRLTKLTKKMARSRSSWKKKTASGICITKLVVDHFVPALGRDDEALHETWKAIKFRLLISMQVDHPIYPGKYLASHGDEDIDFFRSCLNDAVAELNILEKSDCTRDQALKAWNTVFNTNFFSEQTSKSESTTKSLLQPATTASAGLVFPDRPVIPNKSSGFA